MGIRRWLLKKILIYYKPENIDVAVKLCDNYLAHGYGEVDIISEKVELINQRKSPIQDEYIEKYLAEKELDLTATLDAELAYKNADFVVIAAPTVCEANLIQ